jgi:hypothetical protein
VDPAHPRWQRSRADRRRGPRHLTGRHAGRRPTRGDQRRVGENGRQPHRATAHSGAADDGPAHHSPASGRAAHGTAARGAGTDDSAASRAGRPARDGPGPHAGAGLSCPPRDAPAGHGIVLAGRRAFRRLPGRGGAVWRRPGRPVRHPDTATCHRRRLGQARRRLPRAGRPAAAAPAPFRAAGRWHGGGVRADRGPDQQPQLADGIGPDGGDVRGTLRHVRPFADRSGDNGHPDADAVGFRDGRRAERQRLRPVLRAAVLAVDQWVPGQPQQPADAHLDGGRVGAGGPVQQ